MKKLTIVSCIISIAFFAVTGFDTREKETPRSIIQLRLASRTERYQAALRTLRNTASDLRKDNKASVTKLRNNYMDVREAFKAWEYLAEHLDPVFVRDNINGSPLPKLERNTFGMNVLEARGMQVLDEAVFTEDPIREKDAIIRETNWLLDHITQFNTPVFLYDRNVFEGIRTGLIRVYNLGLTGFDVPGSEDAITDAITVLQTMSDDIDLYAPAIRKTDTALSRRISGNFRECISYLQQHRRFDQPDRLYLLKQFINPLYADILKAHQLLGIEMIHEVTSLLPPYNHLSDNLFANDFLDASRYMTIPSALQSEKLVELGRNLFFDPILSATNERSCASCHNPQKAFTDGVPKSMAMGMEGTVERNAPTLINCVYSERYFHDLRADALEDQIEHVMVGEKEFNTGIFEISSKLSMSDTYRQMFDECFILIPGNKITKQTISYAIAAYVGSLKSFNSPFDRYVRGEQTEIDPTVKRGFNLFMGKAACGTCHFAPVFNGTVPPLYTDTESEVLGVPENPYAKKPVVDPDEGRGKAKLKEAVSFYKYSFKTPTVRNIALTAPYMHNGAYKTLDDVMDFYNKGGGKRIGIPLEHQTLPFDKLDLTKQEIKDIISFMRALTDTTGLTSSPARLPQFSSQTGWNNRKVGGVY